MNLVSIKRALISVSDKRDLIPFARALEEMGTQIISTGGTAKALKEAGIAVVPIEEVTGLPEMMDGRVKTLHPVIHGALLARRDEPSHMAALSELGGQPIDLVCVNLYPFEQTIMKDDISPSDAIEQIDIGGPTIVRSAAKNFDSVAVLTSPEQYDFVVNELTTNDGQTTLELRRQLAAAAFTRTAQYDTAISGWMSEISPKPMPDTLRIAYTLEQTLRYGENPHQKAALYVDSSAPEPGVVSAKSRHGKPLSYNNMLDASAALEVVRDLNSLNENAASATVVKHTNPCGAAIASDGSTAIEMAYNCDSLAAFGGIVAIDTTVDQEIATAMAAGNKFFEVIVAPEFTEDGFQILADRWSNVRLLSVGNMSYHGRRQLNCRSIPGGLLVQEHDTKTPRAENWQLAAGPEPTEQMVADAQIAMIVTKHLKSNAIAIAHSGALLGAGPGQVDRVSACHLAISKAGDALKAAAAPVAASDAFFPFADGPQILIDAGIKCIIQPGGSRRDDETIALCEKEGITLLMTGVRHFRH